MVDLFFTEDYLATAEPVPLHVRAHDDRELRIDVVRIDHDPHLRLQLLYEGSVLRLVFRSDGPQLPET